MNRFSKTLARTLSALGLSLALAGAISTAACTTYAPPTVAFATPASAAEGGWSEILAHPSHVTVETLVTGEVEVPRDLLLDESDPRAAGRTTGKQWVPVLAHLIHHPTKGDLLVDTGLDHTFADSGHGNVGGLAVLVSFARQEKGRDIAAQLAARHARPTHVFFTHLHVDHTAGAPDLPKDARFVAGKGSLGDAYLDESGWVMHLSHLEGVKKLEELDFSRAPAMGPLGPAIDVFGDGSFWAIWTPGHSVGHVSYLVNAKSGPVLLVGDASHTGWGFEHGVAPGKVTDRDAARRSLEQLRAFVRAYPSVRVVYGHDTGAAQ